MAVVAGDQADAICARLQELPYGNKAAVIGEIVADHPGKVVIRSAIGGRRVVNMLVGAQLPRIC